MNNLRAAVVLLRIVAAVLAVLVVRKRPEHKPIAVFLIAIVIASLARLGIEATGIVPTTPSPEPLTGLPRLAAHTLQAAHILWPFGVVALVGRVFADRGARAVAVGYVLAVGVLVAGYPTIRGDLLARTYTAFELASLLISLGLVVQWVQRRLTPTLAQVAAWLVLALEFTTLLGPYRAALFWGWERSLAVYSVLYAALALLYGGILLWCSPSSPSD
jgi:hypothetical protein